MTALTLLTRAGCSACERAQRELTTLADEFDISLTVTDVDEAAVTDSSLRAEFGDRLPVVLLDSQEHSYWEVDGPRLRADLKRLR
ncbi:MAG: glutaredoxin family protein [Mycobacterium sp.]